MIDFGETWGGDKGKKKSLQLFKNLNAARILINRVSELPWSFAWPLSLRLRGRGCGNQPFIRFQLL